jgi:hypothetical protein
MKHYYPLLLNVRSFSSAKARLMLLRRSEQQC